VLTLYFLVTDNNYFKKIVLFIRMIWTIMSLQKLAIPSLMHGLQSFHILMTFHLIFSRNIVS